MRARDIVGRRIARVEQRTIWDLRTGTRCTHLSRLVLDDGSVVVFRVRPLEDEDGAIVATVHKVKEQMS